MAQAASRIVQNRDGLVGVVEPGQAVEGGGRSDVPIRLADGRVAVVASEALQPRDDGSYFLGLSRDEVEALVAGVAGEAREVRDGEPLVVPVVAETVEVEKRQVETGRVRVEKRVEVHEQAVAEQLAREDVEVERVPINRVVDGPVASRTEGDTTIIPVLKEVLVVEKRLMLIEEVRITRRRSTEAFSQVVPLRTESITVHEAAAAPGPEALPKDRKPRGR